jgi:hypothetical protein
VLRPAREVGAHIAQRVRLVHIAVAHRAALRQSIQRMHHRIGLPSIKGFEQTLAIHHIGDNGLRSQSGEQAGFSRGFV